MNNLDYHVLIPLDEYNRIKSIIDTVQIVQTEAVSILWRNPGVSTIKTPGAIAWRKLITTLEALGKLNTNPDWLSYKLASEKVDPGQIKSKLNNIIINANGLIALLEV